MNNNLTLFPIADSDCIFDDEENQSVELFMQIGKRKPNFQGTGRHKLTCKRNKILIIYFGKIKTKPLYFPFLISYLQSFLLLDIDIIDEYDAIDFQNHIFHLNGEIYDIKVNARRKKKRNSINSIDVFEIFDVLVHCAKEPYCSVIGIFDVNVMLTEDGNEVMGRACGDRVCCVSLYSCNNIKSLITTLCHEILHTLGFDHNTKERCVMNAIASSEEWLFLSLSSLKKLQIIHEEWGKSSNYNNLKCFNIEYHMGLLNTIKFNIDFKDYCKWLEHAIEYFKTVDR